MRGLLKSRFSTVAQRLVEHASSDIYAQGTRCTVLSNGIRVATHRAPSHFSSVGVYIDAGSKYEHHETVGFSHLMDRMAFKVGLFMWLIHESTQDYPSDQLVAKVESMGGNIMAHASRESIMYQAAVFNDDVPQVVSLLASIVQRPLFLSDELDEVRMSTSYELQDMQFRPDMILPELLHQVAYRNKQGQVNTLGHPLLCTMDRLGTVTCDELIKFRDMWYTPDRMVIAAVGVDHDTFVHLAEQHFGDVKPATQALRDQRDASMESIQYSGGIHLVDAKSLPESPNPDDIPLTHVSIAFESMAMSDPDIYALATLASLLGGGGSFSGKLYVV
jgi:processing peptidase subunit alpha